MVMEKTIKHGDTVFSLCYFNGRLNIVSGEVYEILEVMTENSSFEMYMFQDEDRRYSLPKQDLFQTRTEARLQKECVTRNMIVEFNL